MLALAIGMAISMHSAVALPAMSIPYLTVGANVPIVFANPQQAASLLVIETNTSHLASTDTEALAISFPFQRSGPTTRQVFAPSIAQTDSRTVVGDITYLFADTSTA